MRVKAKKPPTWAALLEALMLLVISPEASEFWNRNRESVAISVKELLVTA